jgi:dihydrofolate synthase/folylpolyglutamate synthase
VKAAQFLDRLIDHEKTAGYDYDLDAFRRFLGHFGKPHLALRNVIHIAGTKGKGSIAALLHSCLGACGYRVGLFTSPHLCSVHERIRINDRSITESELYAYLQRIAPFIGEKQRARTYFEVLTTVAFLYFLKARTDFVILETGLGGRIDCTNVVTPIITAITRIGYDHQHLLGSTLPAIAQEKAGIIKSNVPLVLTRQRPCVARVLERAARARNARVIYSDSVHSVCPVEVTARGTRVNVQGAFGDFSLRMPMIGRHHAENLSLALAVLRELRAAGFTITRQSLRQGIARTRLRGRFDIVSTKPRIIFDCAHNLDSYAALDATIRDMHIKDFTLVFGTSDQKDFRYCERRIMPRAREILLVQADHPRAIAPARLATRARRNNRNVIIAGTMKNALEYVRAHSARDRTVIITGSFYLWQPEWCKAHG